VELLDATRIGPEQKAVESRPAVGSRTSGTTVLLHVARSLLTAAALGTSGIAGAAEKPSEEDLAKARMVVPTKAENIRSLSGRLNDVWTQQSDELSRRIEEINNRSSDLRLKIAARYNGRTQEYDTEWGIILKRFKSSRQMAGVSYDKYYSIQTDLEKLIEKWRLKLEPGRPASGDDLPFHRQYQSVVQERMRLEYEHMQLLMTDDAGRKWDLYPAEKKNDPTLTHERYLQKLAELLMTPEDIAMFLRYRFRYVLDSADPHDRFKHGTEKEPGDYWQTSAETLERVENGCMVGDCEDLARLTCDILTRKGRKAVVLLMRAPDKRNGHATCVWMEKDVQGRYSCLDIGTTGLDRNGCMYGMSNGAYTGTAYNRKNREDAENGFTDQRVAVDSVLHKYKEFELPMDLYDWHLLNMASVQTNEWESGKGRGGWKEFGRDMRVEDVLKMCLNEPEKPAPPPPAE
jgi:hypothetical protein